MLKITNTHSLAVQRKESKYRAWLAGKKSWSLPPLPCLKHPGTELDRMQLFHCLEGKLRSLPRYADPLT